MHPTHLTSRRAFLGGALAAGGGALLGPWSHAEFRSWDEPRSMASCILILLSGGVSQTDTWDPKEFTPFRPGMSGDDLLGTCRSIATSIPRARFGAGLEQIADIMELGCVVRSIGPMPCAERSSGWRPPSHLQARRTLLEALGALPSEAPLIAPGANAEPSPSLPTTPESPSSESGARFARDLRLALRHASEGASFQLVEYAFEPFAGFDLHDHGASRMIELKRQIDRPIAELIRGLERRRLLDRTLVVVTSEFGRTVGPARGVTAMDAALPAASGGGPSAARHVQLLTEADHGFHAHFHECNAALLFGAGVRRGVAWGRTSDRHPMIAAEDPVSWADWSATLRALRGLPAPIVNVGRVVEGLLASGSA